MWQYLPKIMVAREIPYVGVVILRGENHFFPVRAEAGAHDPTATAHGLSCGLAVSGPEFGAAVFAAGDNMASIRAEGAGAHRLLMFDAVGNQNACLAIPYANKSIGAARYNATAVRMESRAQHTMGVRQLQDIGSIADAINQSLSALNRQHQTAIAVKYSFEDAS